MSKKIKRILPFTLLIVITLFSFTLNYKAEEIKSIRAACVSYTSDYTKATNVEEAINELVDGTYEKIDTESICAPEPEKPQSTIEDIIKNPNTGTFISCGLLLITFILGINLYKTSKKKPMNRV